jgi:hypothetical protein
LLGREGIRTYQVYLTNEKKLSPGSIHTAIAALRFLYSVTLERDWAPEEVLPLPKKPQKLPIILKAKRVGIEAASCLHPGDALTVTKLDRLARSVGDLMRIVDLLRCFDGTPTCQDSEA